MAAKKKKSQEQPAERTADSPHPALKLRHTLRGHTDNVYRMALSPDGRTLASPSEDKTVRLWDVESGRGLKTLEHQAAVVCVGWSPDGTTLAAGTARVTRRCVSGTPRPGDRFGFWKGMASMVSGVAWSPDGKILASCSEDQTVRLWDAASGRRAARTQRTLQASLWRRLVARRQTTLLRLVEPYRQAMGCGDRRGDPNARRAQRYGV